MKLFADPYEQCSPRRTYRSNTLLRVEPFFGGSQLIQIIHLDIKRLEK